MSEADSKVLEERMKGLDSRLNTVETGIKTLQQDLVEILVELRVLGTRVTLYSTVVAFVVSTGLTVLLKFWK